MPATWPRTVWRTSAFLGTPPRLCDVQQTQKAVIRTTPPTGWLHSDEGVAYVLSPDVAMAESVGCPDRLSRGLVSRFCGTAPPADQSHGGPGTHGETCTTGTPLDSDFHPGDRAAWLVTADGRLITAATAVAPISAVLEQEI